MSLLPKVPLLIGWHLIARFPYKGFLITIKVSHPKTTALIRHFLLNVLKVSNSGLIELQCRLLFLCLLLCYPETDTSCSMLSDSPFLSLVQAQNKQTHHTKFPFPDPIWLFLSCSHVIWWQTVWSGVVALMSFTRLWRDHLDRTPRPPVVFVFSGPNSWY